MMTVCHEQEKIDFRVETDFYSNSSSITTGNTCKTEIIILP